MIEEMLRGYGGDIAVYTRNKNNVFGHCAVPDRKVSMGNIQKDWGEEDMVRLVSE